MPPQRLNRPALVTSQSPHQHCSLPVMKKSFQPCQLVLERATDRNMDMFIGIHQSEIKKHILNVYFSCKTAVLGLTFSREQSLEPRPTPNSRYCPLHPLPEMQKTAKKRRLPNQAIAGGSCCSHCLVLGYRMPEGTTCFVLFNFQE